MVCSTCLRLRLARWIAHTIAPPPPLAGAADVETGESHATRGAPRTTPNSSASSQLLILARGRDLRRAVRKFKVFEVILVALWVGMPSLVCMFAKSPSACGVPPRSQWDRGGLNSAWDRFGAKFKFVGVKACKLAVCLAFLFLEFKFHNAWLNIILLAVQDQLCLEDKKKFVTEAAAGGGEGGEGGGEDDNMPQRTPTAWRKFLGLPGAAPWHTLLLSLYISIKNCFFGPLMALACFMTTLTLFSIGISDGPAAGFILYYPVLAFGGLLCVYIFKCTVIFWSIHADLFGKVFVVVPGIISLLFWYYWRRIVTLLAYVLSVAT